MKKYLPLIVLFGLLAFSCNKATAPEETGYYTFELNAGVDQGLTRTDYAADDVTFSWSTDDEISVLFHSGETHKFFTLKTSEGGSATAKFTGQIENGYELGASEAEGGVFWALFPASDQHSWNTTTHLPDFYEAPEVDYTQSHFSANIPMYAQGDADGNFTFKYLTSCYKFVFTDVDAAKVKFVVHSAGSGGWYLSGKSPVKLDGSTPYLQCYEGTGSRDVTFIEAVDPAEKKAVFYVPFRGWEPFTPQITLINVDNGATLLNVTAKQPLTGVSWGKLVVLPAKSLSDVHVFVPKINIDGDFSDWTNIPEFGSDHTNRIVHWKATSDEKNIYFYFEIVGAKAKAEGYIYSGLDFGADGEGGSAAGGNVGGTCEVELLVYPFVDNGGTVGCAATQNGHIKYMGSTVGDVIVNGTIDGNAFIETSIPRDKVGSPASGVTVSAGHSYDWYTTGFSSFTLE